MENSDDKFGFITADNLSLFTDLYELTMMQGYWESDHNPTATFELFFRDLPPDRGYMIHAGLQQVLQYIEEINFTSSALKYLKRKNFNEDFLQYLNDFSFSGDLRAIPEGRVVFPDEPLVEVPAPIIEAQLFETLLINQVGFQSLIATKAARMVDMIQKYGDDQPLVDFGSRRAHGTDAGVKAARASYIGGFEGSSNVAAGKIFEIPTFGTMAHSWIESFDSERRAYEEFVDIYGEDSILLIDTYDTVEGAKIARDVTREKDIDIRGVRIDSGNLTELSCKVASIIPGDRVFVSSGVDEYFLKEFLQEKGVSTGFGVGTRLVTSADAPKLEAVYKLMAVEKNGHMKPVMKLSSGKETYPGRKTISRISRKNKYKKDIMGLGNESLEGEELLDNYIKNGISQYDKSNLESIRNRVQKEVNKLPHAVREVQDPDYYPMEKTSELETCIERTRSRVMT